jgi:hypothetical protein
MTIRELLAELATLEERRPATHDEAISARVDAISRELRERRLALRGVTIDASAHRAEKVGEP